MNQHEARAMDRFPLIPTAGNHSHIGHVRLTRVDGFHVVAFLGPRTVGAFNLDNNTGDVHGWYHIGWGKWVRAIEEESE